MGRQPWLLRWLRCLVAVVLLAGACSAPGKPQNQTVAGSGIPSDSSGFHGQTVLVPAGLEDRFEQLQPIIASTDGRLTPRFVVTGNRADVIVQDSNQISPDVHVARRWSVAVSARRFDLDDISLDQLTRQAASGPLYVAEPYESLVRSLFADASGLRPMPADKLAAQLDAEPTALALVPSDIPSVTVHAVSVDGANPVRGSGDLDRYPLTTRVRVAPVSGVSRGEPLAAALVKALASPDPPVTTVIFTGDIIPTRCVYDQMRLAGDWAAPFSAVKSRLSEADLVVGSLDASISDVGQPIGCEETFNLLAPPQVVEGFQSAHLRAMTVAANHAKDCGRAVYCQNRAFLDTLANLRKAGIEPAGGGTTLTEARMPAVVTANGLRFAILGYDDIADYYHATASSPGTAGLDLTTLADDVRAAAKSADIVVVMPHWGTEYTPDPTDRQQKAAQIAIDAGATMVVGNHPHVVQAAAPLGKGYVAYALGNFIFDQDWSVETTQGVILEAVFRGNRLAEVSFEPLEIHNRLRPVLLSPADGAPILQRMTDADSRLGR
jgi:poly-gamma-glutamate capsule biosynthesis protein CapA/YwtB (metallophosphatase superfamily)